MKKTSYFFIFSISLMLIASKSMFPQLKIDSIATINISCYGQNDGEITVHASGGQKPYKFGLNRGFAEVHTVKTSNHIHEGLHTFKDLPPSDKYWVFVEDSDDNASVKRLGSEIIEPGKLSVEISFNSNAYEPDHFDISIEPNGGIPTYKLLDEEDNILLDDFEKYKNFEKILKSGIHKWYLVDSNKCRYVIDFEIE